MTHFDLRKKFIEFWKESPRNHVEIPSSSLVPENDPTTLFTGSGMQPMMPYLLGKEHPIGTRLVNLQKCFRAGDMEEVGDNRHTTAFEMMGNWSLGDYFKKEQITWYWEFLTEILKLPKEKLYVTVFGGDEGFEKDSETIEIWKSIGVPDDHIFEYGANKNWWSRSGSPSEMPLGEPGGPDSEVFYEFTHIEHNKKFGKKCHPNCDCGRFIEIGNNVFMTYKKVSNEKIAAKGFIPLSKRNIDFGGGLERTLAAINNDPDIFKTDCYTPLIKQLEERLKQKYESNIELTKSLRIITDHLKASVFLIAASVKPSNKDRGYVLRRLLRRSANRAFSIQKSFDSNDFELLAKIIIDLYPMYFESINKEEIVFEIGHEIRKFRKTIENGRKELEKYGKTITGKEAFYLYETFGFPRELIEEELGVDIKTEFEEENKKHQELSRTASAGMFKGGLADHSEVVTKYHTATHLLHAALRKILGEGVHQEGSNLTAERLRFDFSYPKKLGQEEIKKVEDLVNEQIKNGLEQKMEIMPYDEAIKSGALAFFKEKYPEKVTVYSFCHFSREICGGPHIKNTKELKEFKIIKEESVSSGIRRIYGQII